MGGEEGSGESFLMIRRWKGRLGKDKVRRGVQRPMAGRGAGEIESENAQRFRATTGFETIEVTEHHHGLAVGGFFLHHGQKMVRRLGVGEVEIAVGLQCGGKKRG